METDLKNLRIDRSRKKQRERRWPSVWIVTGITVLVLAGVGRYIYGALHKEIVVDTLRVVARQPGEEAAAGDVILNATGYIVAAHKIELASKVVGKVAWIGVDKGDHVKENQELVRLEDDEYRANLQNSRGNLLALEAKLEELQNGSRPEEIDKAKADLDNARADVASAKATLDRTRSLVAEGVFPKQNLDDSVARYDGAVARVASLERTYELAKLGPRHEQIDAVRGQIEQARGSVAYAETELANTVIRAPVTGTILERNVEKGEFVTTGFVGDRGAKGYVVSIADLNDLKVELDINQNDFAKLGPQQRATLTTDAFPDKHYAGVIDEVSPEANRQKATVQVKVKVLSPDSFLRPEMNANVSFLADPKPKAANAETAEPEQPEVFIPQSAVRGSTVFLLSGGKALKRAVKTGLPSSAGVRVESGLIGGETLILNPPADLEDGQAVRGK
jgi:HlyD family secretion protein